ncbi:MAG: PQQ-binding-like beta-propeller repeat protein [Alphaproteobacteria bacterium]
MNFSWKITNIITIGVSSLVISGCSVLGNKDFVLPGERTSILADQENMNSQTSLDNMAKLPGDKNGNFGAGVRTIWAADVGFTNNRYNSQTSLPEFSGGRIYTLDNNSQVKALSSGGGIIWKAKVNREGEHSRHIGGGVTKASDGVYAGTGSAQLVKLSNTGSKIWAAEADAAVKSAPLVTGGMAYVHTAQDDIIAFSTSDGQEKWRYKTGGGADGYQGNAALISSGGKVIALLNSGHVVALNAKTGSVAWQANLFNRRTNFVGGSPNAPRSEMKLVGGSLYVATAEGEIASLSPSSGSVRWKKSFGVASNISVSGGSVFLIDENDILRAISASNGSDRWSVSLQTYNNGDKQRGRVKWFGPAIAGGNLYILSNRGHAIVFSTSGKPIRGQKLKSQFATSPIANGSNVYAFGTKGKLYAIR